MIDNLHFVKDLGLRQLEAARAGRRRRLRRPDARALGEQEEAVDARCPTRASTTSTTSGRDARRARRQAGRRRCGRLPDVLRRGHPAASARRCARRGWPSSGSASTRPAAPCSCASRRRHAVRDPGRRARHPDVAGRADRPEDPAPGRRAARSPTGSSAGSRAAGVTSVVYCIGYLGDQVRDHVGDGARVGPRASTTSTRATDLRGTARRAAPGRWTSGCSTSGSWSSTATPGCRSTRPTCRREPRGIRAPGADDRVSQRRSLGRQQRRVSPTDRGQRYEKGLGAPPRPRCAGSTTASRCFTRDTMSTRGSRPAQVADLAPLCTRPGRGAQRWRLPRHRALLRDRLPERPRRGRGAAVGPAGRVNGLPVRQTAPPSATRAGGRRRS